jgi:AcrR family transcriptional regulator
MAKHLFDTIVGNGRFKRLHRESILSTGEDQSPKTRERILLAAGEVFAECGFRKATVREICRRAKSNIAAVNYHFRDKERLYAAVLRHAHDWAQAELPGPAARVDLPAAQRLHEFVRGFLRGMCSQDRPAWFGRLMAQELMEPTAALDEIVAQFMQPRRNLLTGIVGELLGPQVSPAQASLCAVSIIGQCLHFHFGRPIITRLNPDLAERLVDVEAIAEHITRFSLAACQHQRGEMDTGVGGSQTRCRAQAPPDPEAAVAGEAPAS